MIWDNAPAHRSEPVREYQGTPGLALRLMKLPGYSPDATPVRRSGHGRDWKRQETCAWGPRPKGSGGLAASSLTSAAGKIRKDEVRRRHRSILQLKATISGDSRSQIPSASQRHTPAWYWFRLCSVRFCLMPTCCLTDSKRPYAASGKIPHHLQLFASSGTGLSRPDQMT